MEQFYFQFLDIFQIIQLNISKNSPDEYKSAKRK